MSCLFSAQGELQCTETFKECADLKLNIGFDNRTNCGDVCTWYGYKNSCPMFAKYPEMAKPRYQCECSSKYKNTSSVKDPGYYSSIGGHGSRTIGGSRAQVFNNISPNECYWKNHDLKGNGYYTLNFKQGGRKNEPNEKSPGFCSVHFNG